MKLSEKMSYLKGLLDGMEINTDTKEGKALVQMTEVMQEMVKYVNHLQVQVDNLAELCDVLDTNLSDVEEELYGFEDCDCDCDCDDDDYDFDFDGDELYEVCCPECGNTVVLDEEMMEEGSIDCPSCGACLEFDFDNIEPAANDDSIEDF